MQWFVVLILAVGSLVYYLTHNVKMPTEMTEAELAGSQRIEAPPAPPPPPQERPIQDRLNQQTIGTVRNLLIDTNPEVRRAAMDLLYNFKDPEAIPNMIKALQEESDPEVLKYNIDLILKDMNEQGLQQVLIPALKHYNAEVRKKAVEAITRFDRAETIPVLTAAMKDQDNEVKVTAIAAVKQIQANVEAKRKAEEEARRRAEEEAAKAKQRE